MAAILGLPPINEFNGLDIKNMVLNSAYIVMNTSLDNLGVYVLRDDCFNCPYELKKRLHPNVETAWLTDVSVPSTWRLLNVNEHDVLPTNERNGLLCEMRPILGEYGVYKVRSGRCDAKELLAPINSYLPLLLLGIVFLSAYFIYGFIKFAKHTRKHDEITTKSESEKVLKSDSLQVLRGLLITLLIFATSGGGGYPLFNTRWGGLSMADVIFFLYTWTVGVYIPIFVDNERSRGKSKWYMVKEIVLRGFVLALMGTLIDSTIMTKAQVNLWKPLQRLGISYVTVGIAYVLTVQKFVVKSKRIICKMAESLVSLLWCWIFSGCLLAVIAILISTFASINCVSNMKLSDATEDHSGLTFNTTETCKNDFTESANIIFVATAKKMINVNYYIGFSEGLLGVITTIMITMIGLKAGNIFVRFTTHGTRMKLWCGWAMLFMLSGGVFAWARAPLEFNLMPISTIVLIPTMGMFILIAVYTMIEMLRFPKLFKTTGLSSIAVLAGHLLFSKSIPFVWNVEFGSHIVYLMENIWTILLWTVIGAVLVKKNLKIYL